MTPAPDHFVPSKMDLARFLEISRILTGLESPGEGRANHYLALLATPDPAIMRKLLALVEGVKSRDAAAASLVVDAVRRDSALLALAQRLTLLWYGGGLVSPDGKSWTFVTPGDYFAGLVWSLALAHPPGLSGGYFGHWRYPPDGATEFQPS